VDKYTITPPIPSTITSMELDVASIVGWKPTLDNNSSYEWKMYPKAVLLEFMNEKRIGALTRILIDHTAEELFDYFSTMARNLFNDSNMGGVPGMGPSNIPAGAMTSNIPENAPPGSHVGSFVGRPATGGIFGKAEEEQFEDRRGQRGQDSGQVYVGRNSMLAQMQDPSGKNKTQQVIMVENMLGKLDEILESYRAREKREDRIEERLETLVDRASYDDEELMEVIDAYKRSRPEMMKEMEQAVAVAAAVPTIFEGIVGAIENEIQPSAPLMRRYDGTTMRDAVYGQMVADRNSGIAQARNPPTSSNIFANPNAAQVPTMTPNMGMNSSMNRLGSTSQDAIQAMQALRQKATDLMMSFVENMEEDHVEAMMKTLFVEDDEELDMSEILTVALMRYMKETGGEGPSGESIAAVIKMMEPFGDQIMDEMGHVLRDASVAVDGDGIVTFFDTAAMDE